LFGRLGIGKALECGGDVLLIDIFGVVGTAVPFKSLFGFLAAFAGDAFNELKVAGRTAAVFGRASVFTA
jgi:hypothetical protein